MIEIPNFRGYYCNKEGLIFSNKQGGLKEIKGWSDSKGYRKVCLKTDEGERNHFYWHRLIMMVFKGNSDLHVNHIDYDKNNNSLANLEYVTQRENNCHQKIKKGNLIGVHWSSRKNKWRARLKHNGINYSLGLHNTPEEAKKAYIQKTNELNIVNRYATK